ncbi:MAG: hypothetical protein JXB19_00210 [Bacteroidales bacterium]|nr:hypothetical protein [Bacteroidales bacterium]
MNNLYFPAHIGTEEGKVMATIKLRENHAIFRGHFPGNPILPGVCLIQIIKELMAGTCNSELQLTEAGNIKYLAFINPHVNDTLHVEVLYKYTEGGGISCNARVFYESTNFCTFKGMFAVYPDGVPPRRGVSV